MECLGSLLLTFNETNHLCHKIQITAAKRPETTNTSKSMKAAQLDSLACNGLQPNSDGLQPTSDGLQPFSFSSRHIANQLPVPTIPPLLQNWRICLDCLDSEMHLPDLPRSAPLLFAKRLEPLAQLSHAIGKKWCQGNRPSHLEWIGQAAIGHVDSRKVRKPG